MNSFKIGVLMLAHRRPRLLGLIRRQVEETWPGAEVLLTVDRPTTAVVRAVQEVQDAYPSTRVIEAPFPVVSDRERFPELRRWQLDQVRELGAEYWAIWDDDHVLEYPELAAKALEGGADLVYARKVFFWDTAQQYNVAVPDHNSVLFFRLRPGDQFPLDRIIHAPAGVHDDPASRAVHGPRLLDVGYLDWWERERVFNVYKCAGKIDAATLALVREPQLVRYQGSSVWHRELIKAVGDGSTKG